MLKGICASSSFSPVLEVTSLLAVLTSITVQQLEQRKATEEKHWCSSQESRNLVVVVDITLGNHALEAHSSLMHIKTGFKLVYCDLGNMIHFSFFTIQFLLLLINVTLYIVNNM